MKPVDGGTEQTDYTILDKVAVLGRWPDCTGQGGGLIVQVKALL